MSFIPYFSLLGRHNNSGTLVALTTVLLSHSSEGSWFKIRFSRVFLRGGEESVLHLSTSDLVVVLRVPPLVDTLPQSLTDDHSNDQGK